MSTHPQNPYRLPTDVIPTNYQLEIAPDLHAATFTGRVRIDLEVGVEVSTLRCNAIDLIFDDVTLIDPDGRVQHLTAVFDETYEWVTFDLDAPLGVGAATLEIAYHADLNDKLAGFYKSTYEDADGVTQVIATTQFEATDARRAFPCWDEPTFKATFNVTLRVPGHLAAYSNSPVVAESDNPDGTRTVVFAPTMKMSSYLVAFVVGPFEQTEPVNVLGTPLRVVYPVGKGHLAPFAIEAGEFALTFFSNYFDIPYPGDKLDLVAVPDFAFGAMENLGCVTFRETALLVDPATASLAELERVADVVAHEIAHMWFGDLVTMQWWEGIWLNEAFATFMETLCVEHFRPQWKKWLSVTTFRDMAMQIDGLHSTRPIEYEVVSPAEMRGMFDLLTYEKGGAVLRMLEQYLGADVFRDGIRRYLRTHAYANTVTTDLWDALEAASGEPVREMMNTWILQGGHPIVTYADGTISQAPFAYGSSLDGTSAIGEHWLTPVSTRSANGGMTQKHLLGDTPIELVADGPMVVNAGGWGVFRTRYGTKEMASIAASLDRLDELERTVLFADSAAALSANQVSWDDFVRLARGLSDQDEPATWTTIAAAFEQANRVANEEQRARLAGVVDEIFGPQLDRLGWDARAAENELAAQVRSISIGILGTVGRRSDVKAEAARRYDADEFDGDIARSVLRVTASLDRAGDYEEFLARFHGASSPQDKQRYQFALADFNVEAHGLDAAARCFDEFRSQDGPITLGLLSRNVVSGRAVWRYITSRWDEAMEKFPVNGRDRICGGIPFFIADRDFAGEVESFHRAHPIEGEQRTIDQLLERMHVGLAFADAIRPQL